MCHRGGGGGGIARGLHVHDHLHLPRRRRRPRGLSPLSRRLLTALAETAAFEFELATARRAAFWGKVRAATLATVAAIDVALAAYLYARRVNGRYDHVLPPTCRRCCHVCHDGSGTSTVVLPLSVHI
ncbi:hypothetical protein BS78_04G326300 [Paspalum vaginatum]|nr:hypothetical protein BS78_04G326300 [Paspalum vaginatum]KAJ1281704.1 hypothetical protein BS78_04G326300 [Paspalum vaginatum]